MDEYKRLYEIKERRFSVSPFCVNQAQAAKKAVCLLENCKNDGEALETLDKNNISGEIMRARELDNLSALKKAAEENGFVKLAEGYASLYAQLEKNADSENMGDVRKKADDLRFAHALRHYHFNNIFISYVNSIGDEQYTFVKDSVVASLDALKTEGDNFFEMAKDNEYRRAVPMADKQYEIFVDFVKNIYRIPSDPSAAQATLFAQTWKIIKDNKSKITRTIPEELADEYCLALPQDKESGKYEFITIKAGSND